MSKVIVRYGYMATAGLWATCTALALFVGDYLFAAVYFALCIVSAAIHRRTVTTHP